MREFKVFFFTLFIVLLVTCFAYHSRLMPMLLLAFVLVCGTSWFLALISWLCLNVKIVQGFDGNKDLPGSVSRKEPLKFSLRIQSRFILPLTPVRIYVRAYEAGKFSVCKNMVITDFPPMKELLVDIPNLLAYQGEHSFGIDKVEMFDLLKIFRFTHKIGHTWTVNALLREIDVDELTSDNRDEADTAATVPHGFNKDVFSHLREYREGEPLRHIHWKMSARSDELIVKQMECNYDSAALVFCDYNFLPFLYALTSESHDDDVMPEMFASCADYIAFAELQPSFELSRLLESANLTLELALAVLRHILSLGSTAVYVGAKDNVLVDSQRKLGRLSNTVHWLSETESLSALLTKNAELLSHDRAVYLVVIAVTAELVETLREFGLLFRDNVTLLVPRIRRKPQKKSNKQSDKQSDNQSRVQPEQQADEQPDKQQDFIRYIKRETLIKVVIYDVEENEPQEIKADSETESDKSEEPGDAEKRGKS